MIDKAEVRNPAATRTFAGHVLKRRQRIGLLEDGYSVCRRLWIRQLPGTQIAAGLVQDHPQLTTDQAGQFVLAAYHDLCPVPGGAYDYWAYSTS